MMTKSGPQNRKELCLQREFSAVDTAKWAPESWHNFRNWAMKQGDVSVTERKKPRGAGSEVCLEPEVVTLQLGAGWGALDLQFHRVESLHLCWSVQFSSVSQSCPTVCDPMNRSTPGLPVHHQLPEFTQTHVHWVSDAIQPSHPLSSPSPPAPQKSLPASESFPMSQLFAWSGQSTGVSQL